MRTSAITPQLHVSADSIREGSSVITKQRDRTRRCCGTLALFKLRGVARWIETASTDEVEEAVRTFSEQVKDEVKRWGGILCPSSAAGEMAALFVGGTALGIPAAAATATAAVDRWQALGEKRWPELNVALHCEDILLTTNQDGARSVAGAAYETLQAVGAAVRGGRVFATGATVDRFLVALPFSWETHKRREQADLADIDPALIIEDILPVAPELEGVVIRIETGTLGAAEDNITAPRDRCALEFHYWNAVVLKTSLTTLEVAIVSIEDPDCLPPAVLVSDSTASDEVAFGRFTLNQKIGEGGMGAVWLASDRFGNRVAIKQLLPHLGSAVARQRFRREAEIMARLTHPHIARVIEVGEVDGVGYLAMEYIDGVSLADVLAHRGRDPIDLPSLVQSLRDDSPRIAPVTNFIGPGGAGLLPLPQALKVAGDICDALQFAHEHGVLHRDVKPANIMLRSDGEPVLLDFGLAKLEQGEIAVSLSLSGQILGTLETMAPEQAQSSKHITERADIYSLGAVLYRLLTGHRHFIPKGEFAADVAALQEHLPIPLRKHQPQIDRDLEAVLLKSLHPDPAQRYPTARQFGDDLRRAAAREPISARAPTIHYRLGRGIRRHPIAATLALALIVAVLAFATYYAAEAQKESGGWVKIYAKDFTQPGVSLDDLEFWDERLLSKAPLVLSSRDGLALRSDRWCLVKHLNERGDVRVILRLRTHKTSSEGVQFALNARFEPLQRGQGPAGCWFLFGTKRSDLLSRSQSPQWPDPASDGVKSRFLPETPFTITGERKGEEITFSLDGKRIQRLTELLPLRGTDLQRLMFKGDAQLLSLEVYRLALAQRASPVVAGDALLEAGHARDAIRRYQATAQDFRGSSIAPLALTKAYLVAVGEKGESPADEESLTATRHAIRAEILRDYPSYKYRYKIAEADALTAWLARQPDAALGNLPEIFALNRDTRIVPILLKERYPLTSSQADELLRWVRETRELTGLRVSGLGLSSCDRLRGMRLDTLACSNNQLTDLEPMRGMALDRLEFNHNRVNSLAPLQELKLREVQFAGNPILDLTPLCHARSPVQSLSFSYRAGLSLAPLREVRRLDALSIADMTDDSLAQLGAIHASQLTFASSSISKLDALQKCTFHRLNVRNNQLRSLEPLRGMKLSELVASWNFIDNLEPLRGMPLRLLRIEGNQFTSLEPLRGMRLDELRCSQNPITSLEPFISSNPPLVFEFDSETLPDSELERAQAAWSQKPHLARHAYAAEVLLSLRRGDRDHLRRLSRPFAGKRYLFIPRRLWWPKARELCETVGGHLATATSPAEARLLATMQREAGESHVWLGASPVGQEWRWVGGEAWNPAALRVEQPAQPDHALVAITSGDAQSQPATWRLPFIIEWED